MPVMAQTTRRVTYRGDLAGASLLAEMLRREGVTVERDTSRDQRDLAGVTQAVIATLVAKGALTAIEAAVAKFRKHMHDKTETEVTIEDDDPEV